MNRLLKCPRCQAEWSTHMEDFHFRCQVCRTGFYYDAPSHWVVSYNGLLTEKDELSFKMPDNHCIYYRKDKHARYIDSVVLPLLPLDITVERLKRLLMLS